MSETVREAIERIKHINPVLNTLLEESVKQSIILPVLAALGWDRDNSQEVRPAPVSHRTVDYQLRVGSNDLVFIEVKGGNEELGSPQHQNQLLEYCREDDSVKIAVLTNGREWRLYIPVKKGRNNESWEMEGVFCTVDIESDRPRVVEDLLKRFLSRAKVGTGSAVAAAKDYRGRRESEEIRIGAVREAWNRIVTHPNEAILAVIDDATSEVLNNYSDARRRRVKSNPKSVRDFLRGNEQQLLVTGESISSNQDPEGAKFDSKGRNPRKLKFKGETHRVTDWADAARELCKLVREDVGVQALQEILIEVRGPKSRPQFSRDGRNLQKPRLVESIDAYWENKTANYTKFDLICRQICAMPNYQEGSIEVETRDKNSYEIIKVSWPRD